jgi:hypothetical protein
MRQKRLLMSRHNEGLYYVCIWQSLVFGVLLKCIVLIGSMFNRE